MKLLPILLIVLISQSLMGSYYGDLQTSRNLYLELIKNVILNTIYEPGTHKEDGREWPRIAHTMIGRKRMDNIQWCIEDILSHNIPGDFIETGVWRGGATILMRAVLKAYGDTQRIVWVADSFQGLPPPDPTHYPADAGDQHHTVEFLSVSLEQVVTNFQAYGLLDKQVHFLVGFFKDTMPNNPIQQLSLLRLDGDMYESTIQVLEGLYDKLSIGGYIIIDDYTLPGAHKATNDFRSRRNITEPLKAIDSYSVYWKKQS